MKRKKTLANFIDEAIAAYNRKKPDDMNNKEGANIAISDIQNTNETDREKFISVTIK